MGTPQALQTLAGWVASIRGDEASVAPDLLEPVATGLGLGRCGGSGHHGRAQDRQSSLAGSMGMADALIEAPRATGAGSSPPSQGWSCSPMSWIY